MLENARKDMREELKNITSLDELWEIFSQYQQVKNEKYDGSWAKRGLGSFIDGCMMRPIDRFEPLAEKILEGDDVRIVDVLDIMDAMLDMGLYSLMGIRLMAVYFPKEFDRFLQEVMEEYVSS